MIQRVRGQGLLEGLLSLGLMTVVALMAIQLVWVFAANQVVTYAAIETIKYGSREQMNWQNMQAYFQYAMNYDPTWRYAYAKFNLMHPQPERLAKYERAMGQPHFLVDYAEIRIGQLTADLQADYLQDRVLQVEVVACYPLRVAIARDIIAKVASYQNIHCQAQSINGRRLWPIHKHIHVPLHSSLPI